LGAIRDEVSHGDEIAVEDIDLEDDWRLLVLGSSIDAQRPIGEQLREKAKLIREVIGTAEISLEGMRWRPDYEINESLLHRSSFSFVKTNGFRFRSISAWCS